MTAGKSYDLMMGQTCTYFNYYYYYYMISKVKPSNEIISNQNIY